MKTSALPIVGRLPEQAILKQILQSPDAQLIAVYGRRRIGKTFLIETFFQKQLIFSCTGQYKGRLKDTLSNFTEQLNVHFPNAKLVSVPANWTNVFRLLKERIAALVIDSQKKIVFIDEMPWMDTPRSGFLSSFSYFWNTFASKRSDIAVVICGSAASWIINNVINDRGGLHNRITQRLRLLPFTLGETGYRRALLYQRRDAYWRIR